MLSRETSNLVVAFCTNVPFICRGTNCHGKRATHVDKSIFCMIRKIKNKKSLFSLFIVNYKKRKRSQRQNVNNGRRKDFNEKEKSSHSHGFPKNHACTPT